MKIGLHKKKDKKKKKKHKSVYLSADFYFVMNEITKIIFFLSELFVPPQKLQIGIEFSAFSFKFKKDFKLTMKMACYKFGNKYAADQLLART